MAELILTTEVICEKGYIYFVKTGSNGTIEVHRAKAGRPKKVEVKA